MRAFGVVESIHGQFAIDRYGLTLLVVEIESTSKPTRGLLPLLGENVVRPRDIHAVRYLILFLLEERPVRILLAILVFRCRQRRTTGEGQREYAAWDQAPRIKGLCHNRCFHVAAGPVRDQLHVILEFAVLGLSEIPRNCG